MKIHLLTQRTITNSIRYDAKWHDDTTWNAMTRQENVTQHNRTKETQQHIMQHKATQHYATCHCMGIKECNTKQT